MVLPCESMVGGDNFGYPEKEKQYGVAWYVIEYIMTKYHCILLEKYSVSIKQPTEIVNKWHLLQNAQIIIKLWWLWQRKLNSYSNTL